MKAKNYYLISETVRNNVLDAVRAVELDGKTKVSIGAAGSKSARQRGLQHLWYDDVVKSGVGGIEEETHSGVDAKAKGYFAMPIIHRTPEKYVDYLYMYDQLLFDQPWSPFSDYFYQIIVTQNGSTLRKWPSF